VAYPDMLESIQGRGLAPCHGSYEISEADGHQGGERDSNSDCSGPYNQLASATAAVLCSGVRVTMLRRSDPEIGAFQRSLTILEDLVKMCPPGRSLTILTDQPEAENEWKCISRCGDQNFVRLSAENCCGSSPRIYQTFPEGRSVSLRVAQKSDNRKFWEAAEAYACQSMVEIEESLMRGVEDDPIRSAL
jgi:hypothetical protein